MIPENETVTHHHQGRGILCALAGFTFWVLTDACMKLATDVRLPTYEIISVTSAVGMATIFLRVRHARKDSIRALRSLWPNYLGAQLLLGFLGLGSNYTCVIALRHLPLNVFYVSVFTAPMMIAVLASVFLREKLGLMKFFAILVGFGGVVIAINPWSSTVGGDRIGYLAAFLSAASFAGCVTVSRHLMRTEAANSLTFFGAFIQWVFCMGCLLLNGGAPISFLILLSLIGAGLFNAGGNIFNYLAVKHAPAATVAPYHYTQIISGAVIAYLIWHERPTTYLLIGAGIIIMSGLYIARSGRVRASKGKIS